MVKSKFTFFQYFSIDQTWSNISQNKVHITIFFSQILQRRPCPWVCPPHSSLRHDDGVSLTSQNAERNSEGGCSTRREFFALSWFSVFGLATVLLTRRFSSSEMLSIMLMCWLWGEIDDIYVVCIQICNGSPCPMDWSTIVQQLHSSVNAISQISRAFFVVVAVIICIFTLFWNHAHVLSVRIPTGYSLELSQNLPHLISFTHALL